MVETPEAYERSAPIDVGEGHVDDREIAHPKLLR
jgi:hypothetical protein